MASNPGIHSNESWLLALERTLESWKAYQHEEDSKGIPREDEEIDPEIDPESYLQNWCRDFDPDTIRARDLTAVRIPLPRVWLGKTEQSARVVDDSDMETEVELEDELAFDSDMTLINSFSDDDDNSY